MNSWAHLRAIYSVAIDQGQADKTANEYHKLGSVGIGLSVETIQYNLNDGPFSCVHCWLLQCNLKK